MADGMRAICTIWGVVAALTLSSAIHSAPVEPASTAPPPAAYPEQGREGEGRHWSPRDSVGLTYFYEFSDLSDESIAVSPDGTKFLFVTWRGDLEHDRRTGELFVYSAADVNRALAASLSPLAPLTHLVRYSSSHSISPIGWAHWDPDGEALTFRSPDEQGFEQLYRIDLLTGALTTLTSLRDPVESIVSEGGTILSSVFVPEQARTPIYPVHEATRSELEKVYFPDKKVVKTWVSYRGGPPREAEAFGPTVVAPSFSADGRNVAVVRNSKVQHPGWAGYERGVIATDAPQFILIDAEDGRATPMVNAPVGVATRVGTEELFLVGVRALWAGDQRHIVLVNTALPLQPGHDPERTRMAYVVSYDTMTGTYSVIEPLQNGSGGTLRRATGVSWLSPGRQLLIQHEVAGKPAAGTVYALREGKWTRRSVASTVRGTAVSPTSRSQLTGGLRVTLKQSANDPPVIMASDGTHEFPLSPPDAALAGIWRAAEEPFEWRDSTGQLLTAGLLLPRGNAQVGSGRKPGLVIQVYSYQPGIFHPDGPSQHAYAAQSLVARGMAVLNMDIPDGKGVRELEEFADRVDSAVDALASRGLIDPLRVGLIGFSRGGFCTYYSITHPRKTALKAAVIDDAFTGTYSMYLTSRAVFGESGAAYETLYAGDFWHNKSTWLEREPTFNVDRVRTPALFTAHYESELLTFQDTIAAFSLNHRPLEFLMFPDADHPLRAPRQRLASYEASVDWMAYWLLGEVPPDAERAAHWSALRTQQQAVLDEAAKRGDHLAPLPDLHPAPDWAIETWRDTHRLIGDLAPDGQHLTTNASVAMIH